METVKCNTLVLGIGNDILSDDGIGPKLCDYIKEQLNNRSIRFEKLNVGGMEILEFIQGYKTVVFIDAIKTVEGEIGNVYVYTPDDFKETLHLSNLHDINFLTSLKLGKSLNMKIPEKLYIIAVEIKEDMIFSEYFTEELAISYDKIKQEVLGIINKLVSDNVNKVKSGHI